MARTRIDVACSETAAAPVLYLRANQLSYDRRRWTLAKNLYEQCVEVDPSYAPAWARLGRINRVIGKFDERAPRPSYQAAEANFRRALELNPDLSIGHNLFAYLEAEIGQAEAARCVVGLISKPRLQARASVTCERWRNSSPPADAT